MERITTEKEIIQLVSNHNVIVSENKSDNWLDAKFIICDFNPNGNGVSINREKIEEWLSSLLTQPLVGKVSKSYNGKEDFTGHNIKIVEEKDETGKKYKRIQFDTQAFGSFYDVGIETIGDVEYITASAKVWKRFSKAYSVFKKRAESEEGLKSSWEIAISEHHKESIGGKDVKVIDSGEFIGHCVLGENVAPAYKSSGVISVAGLEEDAEFFEAISEDIISLSSLSNNDIEDDVKNNSQEYVEGGNELTKEGVKTSALTENDVYSKVRKAINSNSSDKYYYLSTIYPYEFKAYAYHWDREKESDFIEFTYSVNSDDTVSITGQKDVEMVFQPKNVIENQITELEGKVSEAEAQIAEAGKSLTELSKEKENLETQVAELSAYKEKIEEMEAAEQERVLAEKKEELKLFALEDDLITSEEIETDEKLSAIFAELTIENYEASSEKIEVIKGRKAIEKFKAAKKSDGSQSLETSEINKKSVKTDLNDGSGDTLTMTATDIVKSLFLKK